MEKSFKMDFSVNRLAPTQKVLLELVGNALFSKQKSTLVDEEILLSVWQEAMVQTVPLIAFSDVSLNHFSTSFRGEVQKNLHGAFQRNVLIAQGHVLVDRLLHQAGIEYVVMKGLASALYYPDYLMRSMGDVDFLVAKEDFEKADKLFKDNGFVVQKGFDDHHVTYHKNGVRYELHFEPPGIPKGKNGEILRDYFKDLLPSAVRVATEFGEVCVPNAFHHGLIVLLHNVHHLTADGMGLRHLCDWAVVVGSMTSQEFSDLYQDKLKTVGLWHFAGIMSFLCTKTLGCRDVFEEKITPAQCELSMQLLADIFSSGNFGQKNVDRSHEYLLISSKNEKGIKEKSMITQWFLSMNRIVYVHWPFAKKIKLILPFGWLFFSLRYVVRSLTGKRPKIRIKSILKEAEQRKDFYSDLELFENNSPAE
jgi:hypothetical protein